MHETLLNKYGVAQLGYYVESVEDSAKLFAELFGAGPFYDMGVNPPKEILYRGAPGTNNTRCALGHFNNIQIELIEGTDDSADVYKDAGRFGLHHLCIWSDDVDAVVADFKAAGLEVAMDMTSGSGLRVVYFDCRNELGSFIEVNTPLTQLYEGIKAMHQNWDGSRPLRPIAELMGR